MKLKSLLISLALAVTAPGAVLTTTYGPNGITTPFNTVDTFGTIQYTLTYDVYEPPQYEFVFSQNSITVGMYYGAPDYNKYSRIMGYIPSGSTNWVAALLLPGNEVLTDGKWPSQAKLDLWWQPGVTGHLGLMVNPVNNDNPDDTYYGYLKIRWNTDGSLTFLEEAYESIPGKTLSIPVPEPSSLSILASFISFVCFKRRLNKYVSDM